MASSLTCRGRVSTILSITANGMSSDFGQVSANVTPEPLASAPARMCSSPRAGPEPRRGGLLVRRRLPNIPRAGRASPYTPTAHTTSPSSKTAMVRVLVIARPRSSALIRRSNWPRYAITGA